MKIIPQPPSHFTPWPPTFPLSSPWNENTFCSRDVWLSQAEPHQFIKLIRIFNYWRYLIYQLPILLLFSFLYGKCTGEICCSLTKYLIENCKRRPLILNLCCFMVLDLVCTSAKESLKLLSGTICWNDFQLLPHSFYERGDLCASWKDLYLKIVMVALATDLTKIVGWLRNHDLHIKYKTWEFDLFYLFPKILWDFDCLSLGLSSYVVKGTSYS